MDTLPVRFFAFQVNLPEIPLEYRTLYPSSYVYAYEVHRDGHAQHPVLASASVVKGMKDPYGLGANKQDRMTFVIDRKAFFDTNLPFLYSLASIRKCIEQNDFGPVDDPIPGLGRPEKKYSIWTLENLMFKGVRMSIMYRASIQALSDDDKTQAAKRGSALTLDQNQLRPVQMGEIFFNAWQLCQLMTEPTTVISSNITGNGSGLENNPELKGTVIAQARFFQLSKEYAPRCTALRSHWAEFNAKQDRAFVEYTAALKQLQDSVYDSYYPFGKAETMSLSELNAATAPASAKGKVLPKLPEMARFHVPWWQTYGLLTTLEMQKAAKSSLRLPVWFYSLARSDINFFFANKVRFLATCLNSACMAYSITPSELVQVTRLFSSKKQTEWNSETHIARLVAARDVISHMLTLPGFMGKYRSDYVASYEFGTGEMTISGTESCDENRVTGQSDSGDCEDLEVTTRVTHEMLISLVDGSLRPENRVTDFDSTGALLAVARFVDDHYQYLSTSTSTTADYPGSKLLDEVTQINQTKAAFDVASRDYLLISLLKYRAPHSGQAKLGFHQCSVLAPSLQLYEIAMRKCDFDNPNHGTDIESVKSAHAFYKARADKSAAALGLSLQDALETFIPPGIVLESTYPVSTQLIATSVYLSPKAKSVESFSDLSPIRRAVFESDAAAIGVAGRLRDFSADIMENSARVKDIHVLRIMAGHLDGQARVRVVDFDNDRYSTVFWRDICHSINVTMLKHATHTLKMKPVAAGAMSYCTWIDGESGRFGVPMEDFLTGSMRKEKHMFACPIQHKICHPFLRAAPAVIQKMDAALDTLNCVENRPPIILGAQEFSSYDDAEDKNVVVKRQSSKSVVSSSPKEFAQRIIDARIMMIEGDVARNKIDKMIVDFKQASGAPQTNSHVEQTLKLFPVFGQRSTFVYVQANT